MDTRHVSALWHGMVIFFQVDPATDWSCSETPERRLRHAINVSKAIGKKSADWNGHQVSWYKLIDFNHERSFLTDRDFTFSDNQYLASGGNDNRLYVWNQHSLSPVQSYTEHMAAVKAIAWSPHHHGLLVSGGGTADRCIRFWNTLTGQPMQCVDTGKSSWEICSETRY